MNHSAYEPHLAESYRRAARQYRLDDEIEVRSANHQRLGRNLRRICASFGRPIRVLEIGCGTGRYFHWLENVELLIGTDLSGDMLREAENPVCAGEITARKIRLERGNVYTMAFPAGSFDFIYSLGMFGYGASVTPELCAKFRGWLTPGGWLYFDAIEVPHRARWRDRVEHALYPRLPQRMQRWLDARHTVPIVRHSQAMVERALTAAGFSDFVIASNACHSPLWNGTHLECSACKTESPHAEPKRAKRMPFEFATA